MGRRASLLNKGETKGEEMSNELTPADWAEIDRVVDEIMEEVMRGSTSYKAGEEDVRRGIRNVLIRHIMTDLAASETEEIHQYGDSRYQWHHIRDCRLEFCGRYAGQRRDSR